MMRAVLLGITVCLSGDLVWADKDVALPVQMAKLRSPIIHETFDGEGAVARPMLAPKGEWKVTHGTLIGKELASDQHAAVLNYQRPNRNSVVRFSFKVEGSTQGLHFSLNRKGGHLFRVIVTPNRLAINLDKDKKDPKSKAKVLASAKGEFLPDARYTMQVEMVDDRVHVQVDNGITVSATHDHLDVDKPNYRFVMRGDRLVIDDFRVWEAG